MKDILKFFQDIDTQSNSSDQRLVFVIFKQNLTSTLISLLGGVVLALAPIAIIAFNGFVIGYVIHFLYAALPVSVLAKTFIILITLVPHGIFELSMVFISTALGIRLGLRYLLPASKGKRFAVWKADLQSIITFIPLLIVILAIAAVVEVFVSGKLGEFLVGKLL